MFKELIKLYFSTIKKASDPKFIKEYCENINKKNKIEKYEIEKKYNEIKNDKESIE